MNKTDIGFKFSGIKNKKIGHLYPHRYILGILLYILHFRVATGILTAFAFPRFISQVYFTCLYFDFLRNFIVAPSDITRNVVLYRKVKFQIES